MTLHHQSSLSVKPNITETIVRLCANQLYLQLVVFPPPTFLFITTKPLPISITIDQDFFQWTSCYHKPVCCFCFHFPFQITIRWWSTSTFHIPHFSSPYLFVANITTHIPLPCVSVSSFTSHIRNHFHSHFPRLHLFFPLAIICAIFSSAFPLRRRV